MRGEGIGYTKTGFVEREHQKFQHYAREALKMIRGGFNAGGLWTIGNPALKDGACCFHTTDLWSGGCRIAVF
jgi:hypothetical protein